MVSDTEALEILGCTPRALQRFIGANRIHFDKTIQRNRLSLLDIWDVKREQAERAAWKAKPQTHRDIVDMLDQLAIRRLNEYCIIDDWLAEYCLVTHRKRYIYGRKVLMTSPPGDLWYVYHLCHPDGRTFYVGKGKGLRMYDHAREARSGIKSHKCNIIRKLWRNGKDVAYCVVFVTPVEQEAYRFEYDEMQRIGMRNLSNISNGIALGNRSIVSREYLPYEQFIQRAIGHLTPKRRRELSDQIGIAVQSWARERDNDLRVIQQLAMSIGYAEAVTIVNQELDTLASHTARQRSIFDRCEYL